MSEAQDLMHEVAGIDVIPTNDATACHALMLEADLIERFGTVTAVELVFIRAAAFQAAEIAAAHMQMNATGHEDAAIGRYAVMTQALGRTLWTLGSTEKLIGSAAFGTLEMAFRTVSARLEEAAPAGSA